MDNDDRRKALEEAKSKLRTAEAEADAARRKVREVGGSIDRRSGITKRDVAKAWVAPLVMAVNMPDRVFAQNSLSPVGAPTEAPTPEPTPQP